MHFFCICPSSFLPLPHHPHLPQGSPWLYWQLPDLTDPPFSPNPCSHHFSAEKQPISFPGHPQLPEEEDRYCYLRNSRGEKKREQQSQVLLLQLGWESQPIALLPHVLPVARLPASATATFLCASPSLPSTPRCLCEENYPFLRLHTFRDLASLHTAAIAGNLNFRGNSSSWVLGQASQVIPLSCQSPSAPSHTGMGTCRHPKKPTPGSNPCQEPSPLRPGAERKALGCPSQQAGFQGSNPLP